MSKDKGIKLSKKHGVQPTIPLCPVCGEAKNQVALLGAAGDKLAKALGHEDGAMPMHAHIPGDLEPCDKCKERGIAIYVVECTPDEKPGEILMTALVKQEAIERLLQAGPKRDDVLKRRVMFMTTELARQCGLMREEPACAATE